MSVSELIESFVPMLGFPPEDDSLVVAVMAAGAMQQVVRGNLESGAPGIAQMAALVNRSGGDGAVAVIVSALPTRRSFDVGQVFAVLAGELGRGGVPLTATYVVDRIEAGGRWYRVGGREEAGVLGDPAQCAMAPQVVMAGRRSFGSREELAAVVARDVDRSAVLLPLIRSVASKRNRRGAVRAALRAARLLSATGTLGDDELAAVGASLVDPKVHNVLLAGAVSDRAGEAEMLWTLLARALPAPWRAEALVLVAVSAYVRSDTSLAAVAILAALTEDSDHDLARRLDIALHFEGMRPDQIHDLVAPAWYRRHPRLDRLPCEMPAYVRATADG